MVRKFPTKMTKKRLQNGFMGGRTVLLAMAVWVAMATTTVHNRCQGWFGCSAWTMDPIIRQRHPQNNHHHPEKYCQRLFLSATPTTATPSVDDNKTENTSGYRDLYPPSQPVSNGTIQAEASSGSAVERHTLYYEVYGTGPLWALFLHGGPGAGCFPNHARFFDPARYTIVLLDQRGAGRSTPKGGVVDNTLEYLVRDCEQLRNHLLPARNNGGNDATIRRPWDVVLGGSWGSTLGLAYAQRYPSSVRSLILRGICTLRPSEVDWLFGAGGGSARAHPEAWKNFSAAVKNEAANRSGFEGPRDTLHGYYDCLMSGADPHADQNTSQALRLAAARSWMGWEMSVTSSASQGRNNNQSAAALDSSNRSDVVLVSSSEPPGGTWRFENHLGQPVEDGSDPDAAASRLRRFSDGFEEDSTTTALPSDPRPVHPVDSSSPMMDLVASARNQSFFSRFRVPPEYVPAQAMLTCFYSVNDRFVMGPTNLLRDGFGSRSGESNEETPPLRIIGVQGGQDPICPPDTALDLLESLQQQQQQPSSVQMELRIPLEAGHSMYDPALKHEVVRATDRLADIL